MSLTTAGGADRRLRHAGDVVWFITQNVLRTGLGSAARWKGNLLQHAADVFSRRGADLQSLVYGQRAVVDRAAASQRAQATGLAAARDDATSSDEELFAPRRPDAVQGASGISGDIFPSIQAAYVVQKDADLLVSGVNVQHCFCRAAAEYTAWLALHSVSVASQVTALRHAVRAGAKVKYLTAIACRRRWARQLAICARWLGAGVVGRRRRCRAPA